MPTIIKPGVIPTPKLLWYLAATWKCDRCGCEFRVDADDAINVQGLRDYSSKDFHSRGQQATTKCPSCDVNVTIFEETLVRTFNDVVTENAWLSPQPVKRYLGDL